MHCSGVNARSSPSTWCWLNVASRTWGTGREHQKVPEGAHIPLHPELMQMLRQRQHHRCATGLTDARGPGCKRPWKL